MIPVRINDATGGGGGLRISEGGAAHVIVHPHPPESDIVQVLPYRSYFLNASASNNMAVNGSVTEVAFKITASNKFDVFIKSISVDIGDGGTPNLNGFGALSALSNGVELVYFTLNQGEFVMHDGIKTNKEFVRLGQATGAIGTGADAYLADVSGGATEKSYLPQLDITATFGIDAGLLIRRGSSDAIILRVRDNLSALTTFNAIAYGKLVNEIQG